MKVLSIATRKGGVGKSTMTIYCASMLFHISFKKGLKIALVDFDDQKSIANQREKELKKKSVIESLAEIYPNDYKERLSSLYPIYSFTYPEYLKKRKELEKNFSYVFLDFPGRVEKEQLDVLKTIDKVATPIVADELDIESGMSYMKMCNDLKIETGWFLNKERNTNFTRMIKARAHDSYFLKVNKNIQKIQNSSGELLSIAERPETYRSHRSTIVPFDDKEKNISSLLKFLIN
ncbi:ParA family protein [Chondrinema litorale]|uniref:ParA family protein n=1 Tax=Chondrinema litorale TaxID=2994555 RepID=UPI002543E55F|nr:AAA family ATPase [Chondrinema litorale]UZR98309.1 AAA family ATPase [Chondrinema litorale]